MLHITPVPALSDNYVWILQRDSLPQVVIVDPTVAAPVLDYIQAQQLEPVAILITHQHYDHTGGVADILELYPYLSVIGPAVAPSKQALPIDRPIPRLITFTVGEGDVVYIPGTDFKFEVIAIPGHTLDHLAYLIEDAAFVGDTLFAAGCGRLFSGTAQMMNDSLQRLARLPVDTRLYCAHEYTLDNLGFAKWVEPDNPDVLQRDAEVMQQQENGEVTLPTTVALERATNPFVRIHQQQVIEAAQSFAGKPLQQDWEVFAALREWKDTKYD